MPDTSPQLTAEPQPLAAALSRYLGAGWWISRPASGWETTLYEFELSGRSATAPELQPGVPLVLRFYPSVEAADKGALEYRTLSHLAGAGYPVPRPYLFEPGGAAIGAPFLVMERLGGGPLFAIRSFPQAFKTFSMGFVGFVRAQARLHRMALAPSTLGALGDSGARANTRANTPGVRKMVRKILRKMPPKTERPRACSNALSKPSRRASSTVRCRDWPRRSLVCAPARRSSETPHPRSSTSTTIRKTSWLKDYASPELSIG